MEHLALAACPALALHPQRAERCGYLHADERSRLVRRVPAVEQQLPGQVDVLGRHPRVEAADGEHAVSAEERQDACDDADASGQGLAAADQTDDRRRFQHLQRSQKAAAVGDVRRSRDRCDEGRAADACHEQLDGQGMHVCVGVGDHDQLVPRLREAGVQLLGLAAVDGVADHAAAGVARGCLQRGGLGRVGRAVVENEHLELRVVGTDRRRDTGRDHRLLVVGGDQHGHTRPPTFGFLGRFRLVEHSEQDCSRDPHRCGAHRIEHDERHQQPKDCPHTASRASRATPAAGRKRSGRRPTIRHPRAMPSATAQLCLRRIAPPAMTTSHRNGPTTTPTIRAEREAGWSGSKRTEDVATRSRIRSRDPLSVWSSRRATRAASAAIHTVEHGPPLQWPPDEGIGDAARHRQLRHRSARVRVRRLERREHAADAAARSQRGAHRGGETGLGASPAQPLGSARAPVPRHRPRERLLGPGGRVLRGRVRRLRQANDVDRARRLPDDRPADLSALRPGRPGRPSPTAPPAHLRRRPSRFVDRRRRHPREAWLQRRDVRRCRPRRGPAAPNT